MINDRMTMKEEEVLDFNFWPSFADLMLSLVLILVIVVFLVRAVIAAGTVNLKHVQENQVKMVRSIAAEYGVEPKEKHPDVFVIRIPLEGGKSSEITIRNEPTLQRLSFKDRVLFPSDNYLLSEAGQETLRIVGREIKRQLSFIREIQIQGHADTDPTFRFPSNLHLAALRAIEVFNFLQYDVGIDPAAHLMSATSFGEFKPVQRSNDDGTYNRGKLREHNLSDALKDQNRRIEILLFYRF
ncbi:OmpA family protein [Candidatus Poribacteria bacterium]|nr:OmpA family protein [Candidatus Poribacteria bacterium]